MIDPVVDTDDGDVEHALCASFDDEAYIRFWSIGRAIVVQSMASSPAIRGRAMLQWLNSAYGLPVFAVEVTDDALGFWRRMKAEKLVARIEMADGFPSRYEGMSVPIYEGGA